MLIIEIEGLDKSGKHTQADLLHQALYERGVVVEKSEFHRYDTPTGQLIRKFLDGEYMANQLAIECLMAADKYAQLDWMKELAENTEVLILDRYLSSQIVYSKSNGVGTDFTLGLVQYLPEPDFHIYLDISPDESMVRKGQHGNNDKYESNKQLLENVRQDYLSIMELEREDGRAIILDATKKQEELHSEILESVLSLLNKEEAA